MQCDKEIAKAYQLPFECFRKLDRFWDLPITLAVDRVERHYGTHLARGRWRAPLDPGL